MLRSCIELDLDEHRFLPFHQPDRMAFLQLLSTDKPSPEILVLSNNSSSRSRLNPISHK